ncbi:hypothetical protein [Nonomuraea deserti]|nr:hypothetical protein [Nonomuraea deserti]
MDLLSGPDGGFYGWPPTGNSPRRPWVAWLLDRFEPAGDASTDGFPDLT